MTKKSPPLRINLGEKMILDTFYRRPTRPREKTFLGKLDAGCLAWAQSQPEGAQAYLERLIAQDRESADRPRLSQKKRFERYKSGDTSHL